MAGAVGRSRRELEILIADLDALPYYPDLAIRSSGELAATWVSGGGEGLHWNACLIRFEGDNEPDVQLSEPLQFESWRKADEPDHAFVRTSAGEDLQPLFLKDGSLAVVSPIQDLRANRYGFTFWRFKTR